MNTKVSFKWTKRILTLVSVFFSILLFILVLGILLPKIPYVGEIGTLAETCFSLHLIILSLVICLLTYITFRISRKNLTSIVLILSMINVIGLTLPFISLLNTARENKVSISFIKNLTEKSQIKGPDLSKSVKFTSIDGKDLFMDISKPENLNNSSSLTPVVFLHGGGFISGTRNSEPAWTQFYNNRGYVVFDVDYRLSSETYHTWDKSSVDIVTAIAWIDKHSQDYKVDMNKLIISGNSAGGALALQVAYGIQDGTLKANEPGIVPEPKVVVALYPSQNLYTSWEDNTGILTMKTRVFNTDYLGGSPKDFPKEYAVVSPTNHITKNTPPTIVLAGKSDHLVPYRGQVAFAKTLTQAGIPNMFVGLPFTDHSFDTFPEAIGSQIAFKVTTKFLDKYAK